MNRIALLFLLLFSNLRNSTNFYFKGLITCILLFYCSGNSDSNFFDFKGKRVNFDEFKSKKLIFVTFSWSSCFDCFESLGLILENSKNNCKCFIICPFQKSTLSRRMLASRLTKVISSDVIFSKNNDILIPFSNFTFNLETGNSPAVFLIDNFHNNSLRLNYHSLFKGTGELREKAKAVILNFISN